MADGETARPASQRVVEAVARETGRDPTELEPLYRTLDPGCLDGLFRAPPATPGRDTNRVEFTYEGCTVCVSSDGSVSVASAAGPVAPSQPPDSSSPPSDSASPD